VRGTQFLVGEWHAVGDQVCFANPAMNDGKKNCFRLVDLGGYRYRINHAGEQETGVTIEIDGRLPGDTFKIQGLAGASCEDRTS